ncbi:uncharacterized protein LOC133829270 [Humulus lupulus]|uniref:uncharacterized protein LOC133829270 n=1 Tax=Humulus lupulus TaxID=3486 RepID=UPI002B40B9B7|nr:uncharacterized protein LOC133829270 [Humulus lupulus]
METSEDDRKCSDKKMEGDDGWRTVECLRGRLLAERQASRMAKEESECMESKLIELEKLLKEEIKLRNKSEKKLKKIKKKLQSLNISSSISVESSEQSCCSEKSEASCRSLFTITSSSTSSGPIDSEENESNFHVTSQKSKKNHESPNAENSIDQDNTSFEDFYDNPSHKSSSVDLRSSVEENEIDHEEYVDDSFALVPMSYFVAEAPKRIEIKPVHENVSETVDSLKYIRDKIQSPMEIRRCMVRVGPT